MHKNVTNKDISIYIKVECGILNDYYFINILWRELKNMLTYKVLIFDKKQNI